MKIRRLEFLAVRLAFVVAAGLLLATAGHAQNVLVQGTFISRTSNTPVEGITVYLMHPILGRSAPSVSDAHGRFGWTAIPVRPDSYLLEAYWGQSLVMRQPLPVNAPISIPIIYM